MSRKRTVATTSKRRLPNITDNGFVDIKDAPIIYAYIYDVEALDAEKFNKNYQNTDIDKTTIEIQGFDFENNELIPRPKP
jgi:hypothetical protein